MPCGRELRNRHFNGKRTSAARSGSSSCFFITKSSFRPWMMQWIVVILRSSPTKTTTFRSMSLSSSSLFSSSYTPTRKRRCRNIVPNHFLTQCTCACAQDSLMGNPSSPCRWRKDDHPMSSPLSSGSTSPVHLAAPSSPSSPHSVGLRDRLESETHALNFVKANLTFLFSLLFNIDPTDEAQSHAITASQLDMLGFLFNGGTTHLLQYPSLSAAYPKWQDSQPPHQAASKVCNWLRKRAALNDTLYPPVGSFALSNNPIASMHMNVPVLQEMEVDEGPLDGHTQAPLVELPRPIVISSVSKATVIKRAEEFAANCDVTIHGCHDTYIYVLGPLRHVSVVASSNCKIVLGPASGICTVDRCDSTKVSAVCALLRVNNCLDSTFNIFTPRRSIFTGDNRGLHVGPFNALYAHLPVHLGQSGLAYVRHSTGQWNKFINLDTEEREGTVHADDVVLQSPLHFTEVCVPVKMDPVPPHDPPFALPPDFALAVRKMQDNVDGLRRLIASDEFDAPTKKLLEQAIQVKFKEWLATSGNTRQVLDLVQLEKARHLG
ncbi:hypothetical protein, variant [Aphanomyces invadans]|uniref:C-CAP/cofactor C-like domain-containing protein n=1 Tax=Aphanomyces invadans TaxID=157072 RepID=A0A024URV7_9STRA|nr:hypothetical protein, variant [Aphanomyces invadans]ETW08890.1 hypothetical protein, variant [Aphanomyces invadans]|eukprot:XP_008862695.1 hypothetical protein, variant [Aphanomyces invadans]